ncbi:CBY1-interacting BAR domain-containing protein 1-B-like isoform X2 [Ornithodoros turicata]|uniref:CBY1-interacting BAR domain-containing protein 1-B-like isoform X2 n=1 Tax=Ornithodoros turicata TaxID=34597 RepID=UPI003139690E
MTKDASGASTCEDISKFLQERLNQTECHIGELCCQLSHYSRKAASLRNAGDNLATALLNYSQEEVLNPSLKTALANTAEVVAMEQDFRNTLVHRVHKNVVYELSHYGKICKAAKDELKSNLDIHIKELTKKEKLEKLHAESTSNVRETAVDEKLFKATTEEKRSRQKLERQMETFERRKLSDIKRILLEYITAEMVFHSKALEGLSTAHQHIISISVMNDLQSFLGVLKNGNQRELLKLKDSAQETEYTEKHRREIAGSVPALVTTTTRTPKPAERLSVSQTCLTDDTEYGSHAYMHCMDPESDSDDSQIDSNKNSCEEE